MTKCKGCGADIIFGITLHGKKVPLNAKPEKRYVAQKGMLSDCERPHPIFVFASPEDQFAQVRLMDVYESHFITCPQAGELRKKR